MSAANNSHPERDEDFFEEPDYEKFSDEELDALARGESLDQIKADQKKPIATAKTEIPASYSVEDDLEPEEIDPALERELRAEFDAEEFGDSEDWDESTSDEFDDL